MIFKQIVFNSFPRSGNVYSSTMCPAFFDHTMISTAHMPEIFFVKEIDNVTLFRKPEDAISSTIYQNRAANWIVDIEPGAEYYKDYMKYAIENADLIYIGKFDDLINDPINHFKNIAKKFNRNLFPDYEKRFINANSKLVGITWEEEYSGHIPREKSDKRKHIEEVVKSFPFIQELNQEYEEFILKHKTIV